jgi:hypothetical protein
MKKTFLSLSLALLMFVVLSCSDDTNNVPLSDLNGSWSGETISGNDTARYSCEITEKSKTITGKGKLYGYHKTQHANMTVTDESRREGNVTGTFNLSDVGIKFLSDENNHFYGQLSEDKMSINGSLSVQYQLTDSLIVYPLTLYKQ